MKPAGEPRFAALTSGLLARKGEARPAMRPAVELTGDDLGWNDLGQTPNEPARQQAEIAERLALSREEAAPVAGRKAFTLRLDPARHLALRLACAVRGQSAQAFVTEALDAMLATAPVAAALPKARRVRGRKD